MNMKHQSRVFPDNSNICPQMEWLGIISLIKLVNLCKKKNLYLSQGKKIPSKALNFSKSIFGGFRFFFLGNHFASFRRPWRANPSSLPLWPIAYWRTFLAWTHSSPHSVWLNCKSQQHCHPTRQHSLRLRTQWVPSLGPWSSQLPC